MKIYLFGLFGLLVVLISAPVQAGTLYIALQGGFNAPPDSESTAANPADSIKLDSQLGINAALAVGAKFGNLRAEIEAVYRYNENNNFTQGGVAQGADGSLSMLNIYLNGYYEMDFFGLVSPYAGVGIGYGTVTMDLKQLDGTLVVDDDDTVISYQLMVGVGVHITENWTITGDYRYFDTIQDTELTLANSANLIENSDISTHEVRIGFRYWIF